MSIETPSIKSELDEEERQRLEELVAQRTVELMEANEQLRNSRTKYKALLDGASDAFLMADPNGRLCNANRQALKLLGYSKRELFSMEMEDIFPEDLRDRMKDFWCLILKEGMGRVDNAWVLTKGGERIPVDITASLVQYGAKRRIQGIFRDIRDRLRMEEELQAARKNLLFAVSHELKTPLLVLMSAQEYLLSLSPEAGWRAYQEYAPILQRNLQRLYRNVNNLIDSQRSPEQARQVHRSPCDLVQILAKVRQDLEPLAAQQRVLISSSLEEVPSLALDGEAIYRMAENLLSNAIKFSPKSGVVHLELHDGDDAVFIVVRDHGAGIAPEEQALLFQPFQRSREAVERDIPGSGLGLYVSRMIAQSHGGTLTLESAPGHGTTVTAMIPLHPDGDWTARWKSPPNRRVIP